jgi:hypothetical protein
MDTWLRRHAAALRRRVLAGGGPLPAAPVLLENEVLLGNELHVADGPPQERAQLGLVVDVDRLESI